MFSLIPFPGKGKKGSKQTASDGGGSAFSVTSIILLLVALAVVGGVVLVTLGHIELPGKIITYWHLGLRLTSNITKSQITFKMIGSGSLFKNYAMP